MLRQDTSLVKEGKMFALMLKLQGFEKALSDGAEVFTVSEACKKNIRELCCATILSTHLTAYSEKFPKTLTMVNISFTVSEASYKHNLQAAIQRQTGWGLPAEWYQTRANWDIVWKLVESYLNNKRSEIKKLVRPKYSSFW